MRSAKIMVTEDNEDERKILSFGLKEAGFEVIETKDGAEALGIISGTNPKEYPDVIILDVSLPKMDGFTVCKHIKTNPQTKKIPVIFLSAYADSHDKILGMIGGGSAYIGKPFRVEEIVNLIKNFLS
jgi:twitching motility two-component system response regulator PilH